MSSAPLSSGAGSSRDALTELQNLDGKVLAKRIERGPAGEVVTLPYDRGAKHFRVVERPIGSIRDVAAALEAIGSSPASCVIRGAPRYPELPSVLRRKSHFTDVPRRWSLHDFDGIKAPPDLDWRADPEVAVRHVVSLLPAPFQGATCWWTFTAGQGFKDGLNLRLAFWHDMPVSGADLTVWLAEKMPSPAPRKSWSKVHPVDPAVYRTVQPIYVARPIFGADVVDPVPRRSGLLEGARDVVAVPVPIEPRFSGAASRSPRAKPAKAPALTGEVVTDPYEGGGSGFDHHVSTIGDGPGGLGFYEPLKSAAAAWVGEHGPDADATAMLAGLGAAARRAPRDPAKHTAADVEQRLSNLPKLVEWLRTEERRKLDLLAVPGALCDPKRRLPTLNLAEASSALTQAVDATFGEILAAVRERRTLAASAKPEDLDTIEEAGRLFDDPRRPRIGIGAGIGLGKTEAALQALVRAVRDDRSLRVAYAVPTHATADDVAARLNAMAGRSMAAVWRGTGRPDPMRSERTVCPMHVLVDQVRAVGGSVRDVCGGPTAGWCAHNPRKPGQSTVNACAYRQQFSPDVQVWIVPHAMLSSATPSVFLTAERKLIGAPFDLLVLDEAPWLSLLGGFGPRPTQVLVEDLVRLARWPAGGGETRIEYLDIGRRLAIALEGQSGLPKRARFVEAGLSAPVAARAAALAWRLVVPMPIRRDLPPEAAGLAVHEDGSANGAAVLVVRFWRILAEFLRGQEEVAPWTLQLDRDADGRAVVRLRWKEEIHRHWSGGPILYLDATLVRPVAECWLPGLRVEAEVRAAETHVHRIGIIDKAFGKSSLCKANDEAEERRHARKVGQIVRYVEVLALRCRGRGRKPGPDVAVVTYEALERRIRPRLPANVVTGHFNALRGFDGWSGVAAIVVVGRPEASPRDVEQFASVASGEFAPPTEGGWYPEAEGALLMRDGSGRSVRTYAHPHPRAEAFRQQILTELVQVEGRARSVRRGRRDPLISLLLTNTPTDLPLDVAEIEGEMLEDVRTVSVLLARGIVPDNAADAAKVLPDLFGESRDGSAAFRQRLGREEDCLAGIFASGKGGGEPVREVVTDPYVISLRDLSRLRADPVPSPASRLSPEALATFESYRYRPHDRRTGGTALVDRAKHSDPEAALSAAVGSLAAFSLGERPAWLASARAVFDPAERTPVADRDLVVRLPKAPSPLQVLLATAKHPLSAVLPVADEVYTVGAQRLSVHMFRKADAGADLRLYRTPGAKWPPRRADRGPIVVEKPKAPEPTTTAIDIAVELGARPWMLMGEPRFAQLKQQHGAEKALLVQLVERFGPGLVQAAGARCLARAASAR